MITCRHPNRWAYGGIIQEIPWVGEPGAVLQWDGSTAGVQPGDTILVLRTGAPIVVFVGVDCQPPARAAEVATA